MTPSFFGQPAGRGLLGGGLLRYRGPTYVDRGHPETLSFEEPLDLDAEVTEDAGQGEFVVGREHLRFPVGVEDVNAPRAIVEHTHSQYVRPQVFGNLDVQFAPAVAWRTDLEGHIRRYWQETIG
jgi:hypothetical protein